MIYKKGCTLLDQVYKEGESTWGCKSGVLDVEDVESFILQIGMLLDAYDIVPGVKGKIKERIDELYQWGSSSNTGNKKLNSQSKPNRNR